MNTTIINTNTAAAAARIPLHVAGTKLTDVPGFAALTVKADLNNGRPGAVFRAPELALAEVLALAATNDALGAHLVGSLVQVQRDVVKEALANGANPANGASLAGEALMLPALAEFLASAGVSAVRFTKELMGKLRPIFATLVAARWAAVKPEAAAQMSDDEVLAASKASFDFYWPMLEAALGEKAMLDSRAEKLLPILALAPELAAVSPAVAEYANHFSILAGKVSAAMERSASFEPDC